MFNFETNRIIKIAVPTVALLSAGFYYFKFKRAKKVFVAEAPLAVTEEKEVNTETQT